MKNAAYMPRVLILVLAMALVTNVGPAWALPTAPTTARVSVGSGGVQGLGDVSIDSALSSTGRYVAFVSYAGNLVAGDTNGAGDVFVRDRNTGVTTRVSVSTAGAQGAYASMSPAISADGRFVAFSSFSSNLVAGDTNGVDDVFVRDRVLNTTIRVSVGAAGVQGNAESGLPEVSGDGRYVVFTSHATNLVAGDTNSAEDVFVRDRVAGSTTRVSVTAGGNQGNGESGGTTSISSNGRFVAFASTATNLVTGDTNGRVDVFLVDLVDGARERVSLNTNEVQGDRDSQWPSVSADGRYVAYESYATNLVTGDTNGRGDVFVRDRVAGSTTRASVTSVEAQSAIDSSEPAISADGRYVAFWASSTDLVLGDTNGQPDVFVRDSVAGTTLRASVSTAGAQGNGTSAFPSISGDGRSVAFASDSTNLVTGDTNATGDIFVREAAAVGTSIGIKTTATSVGSGAIPILSGAVTPNGLIGWNIVAYVKKPGKTYWTYSSNRTVYNLNGSAAWQYKYTFVPGMTKGSYVFEAVVPAYPGYLSSTSPNTVTIKLH